MIHLRLIVPSPLTDQILDRLCATTGVAHVVRAGTAVLPAGDVLQVDVARESADDVVEWLQDLDVHRDGAIVIDGLDAVVSDAAARASTEAPGHGAEALIWEEVEARAREESVPDASYLVLGDNRTNSADSAQACRGDDAGADCWRWAHDGEIVGKAVVVLWPIDRWRAL